MRVAGFHANQVTDTRDQLLNMGRIIIDHRIAITVRRKLYKYEYNCFIYIRLIILLFTGFYHRYLLFALTIDIVKNIK